MKPRHIKQAITQILVFCLLLISGTLLAQTPDKEKEHSAYMLKGLVRDATTGDPLVGVTVLLKGTTKGTFSGSNGTFSLLFSSGDTIVVKYLGYVTKEININSNEAQQLKIDMEPSLIKIDEVKVTAQRNFWGNMEVGRNISSIDAKKISLLNTNNASDILQATMPGVWSSNSSGAPGDHQKVRIRGISSVFGCADPLYVIDGVAVPIVNLHSMGIADLNTDDIENVTVLKDAASTALYGYQGANGVVIIETKKKTGNHISFSTKYGVQQVAKEYNLMGTKDFLANWKLAYPTIHSDMNYLKFYPAYSDTLANTNWQNVLFRIGTVKEYQLSGSAEIGKTKINLSGSYYKQDGIITNSNYDKYTLSGRLDRSFSNKLSVDLNFRGSYQANKNNLDVYNGSNLIIEGINKSPCYYSCLSDSFYNQYNQYKSYIGRANRNYYNYEFTNIVSRSPELLNNQENLDSLLNNINYTLIDRSGAINLVGKYLITDNLFLNASTSVSAKEKHYFTDIKHYLFSVWNNYMKSNEHFILYSSQINLTYDKKLGDHQLNLVAGYRNYTDNAYWKVDTLENSSTVEDTWTSNSLAVSSNNATLSRQIQSMALHMNYNYKKKYNVSLLANYEHLEINEIINNYTLFPSLALSWDIAQEDLLKNVNWLKQFSLYTNIGKAGNYPLNTMAKDYYNNVTYYYYGNGVSEGKVISQFANHYLQPEIVTEYNFGTNIGLFDNRLKLNVDYYNKINSNLTIIRDIPYSYGGGKAMLNIGKVSNIGKELTIEIEPIRTPNISWFSSFTISANEQKVKNMGDNTKMEFSNSSDILIPQFEVAVNSAVGVIKGYKYLGQWTTEDAQLKDKRYKQNSGGKYLSADSTSKALTTNDMVTIGKTLPNFTCSWDNQIVYKNFSLDFLWYAVEGTNKFNSTRASTYMSGLNEEASDFIKRDEKSITSAAFYQSSYFVEDASFIRLKRVTFAYQFPKKVFKYADLRLSLSLENFITITKYKGYDPEASIYTDNSFSDFGVDRGAYPNPKSVFFTININL